MIGNRVFCTLQNSITVMRIEFLSDGMLYVVLRACLSYVVLRACWCNIVLYVHALSEEKRENSKDCFIEELDQIFSYFHKYLRSFW